MVLTHNEVKKLFRVLESPYWILTGLMYGSGLRLMEALRLRVKDLDFTYRAIIVRNGKGGKDRVVTLPDELISPLKTQLVNIQLLHKKDLSDGHGKVEMPYALERKWPHATLILSGNMSRPLYPEVITHAQGNSAGTTCTSNQCNVVSKPQ